MPHDFLVRESRSGVAVEWRIGQFMSLAREPGFFLDSPLFSLSDAQWFLRMIPNVSISDDCAGVIFLDLCKRFSSSKKHLGVYTLGIRSADGSVFESVDGEKEFERYGGRSLFPQLVRGSEFRQSGNVLSADGALTVFATLHLAEPTILDEDIPLAITQTEEVSSEWKVEGFTSLPKEQGFALKSPAFSLAGSTWRLLLHPDPKDRSGAGWFSLLLRKEPSSSEKQRVAYSLGIRRRNGTIFRVHHAELEFVTNTEWGCWNFITSSELLDTENGLVHQGSLTLFCTLRADNTATLTEGGTSLSSDTSPSQATSSENGKHSQSTSRRLS